MRKYSSVFGLFAKSSLIKILFVSFIAALAQVWTFSAQVSRELTVYEAGLTVSNLETVTDRSKLGIIFGIAFVIISFFLCMTGTSFSSKTGYTLDRLSISERCVFACQAVYNTFIYLFLWAVELAVCFGLCVYYTKAMPDAVIGNQTIFLAFYRNELLHALLPLSDVFVWIRNIFLIFGLSIATAEYPHKQRHKKIGASAIVMAVFTVIFFKTEPVNSFNTAIIIVTGIINAIEMFYYFTSGEDGYVG